MPAAAAGTFRQGVFAQLLSEGSLPAHFSSGVDNTDDNSSPRKSPGGPRPDYA